MTFYTIHPSGRGPRDLFAHAQHEGAAAQLAHNYRGNIYWTDDIENDLEPFPEDEPGRPTVTLKSDTARVYAVEAARLLRLKPESVAIFNLARGGIPVDALELSQALVDALSRAATLRQGRSVMTSKLRHLAYITHGVLGNALDELPAYAEGERSRQIEKLKDDVDHLVREYSRLEQASEANYASLADGYRAVKEERDAAELKVRELEGRLERSEVIEQSLRDQLETAETVARKNIDAAVDAERMVDQLRQDKRTMGGVIEGQQEHMQRLIRRERDAVRGYARLSQVADVRDKLLAETVKDRDNLAATLTYALEFIGDPERIQRVLGYRDGVDDASS